MCVSIDHAEFGGKKGTVVIFGVASHPTHHRNVHVLAYQNKPKNLGDGPNAMMLHFPARPMSPENLIATENAAHIAEDCVRAVRPVTRGGETTRSLSIGKPGVFVFDSGIYTVVLAQSPRDIPAALALVPKNKRPIPNRAIFDWYADFRPNWPIALCCFDNRKAADATPLLFWYDPLDQNMGFLPALDAHDGRPPRLQDSVLVDHWVIFGVNDPQGTIQGRGRLSRVIYRDSLTKLQRALLPTDVAGRQFMGMQPNGDWLMPVQAIANGNVDAIQRGILPV